MANSKPVLVLVHGIWHSPPSYIKLTTALQQAGYETHVPYLPSCTGVRPPVAGLTEDTQVVRRLVEILIDLGRTVVMLMHSYGGQVCGNALEGLGVASRAAAGKSGGVAHLVGIACHMHPAGSSIWDLVHEMGHKELIPQAFDIADDGVFVSRDPRASMYADVPDAEAEMLLRTISTADVACMEARPQFEAWRRIPITYVRTAHDAMLPPDYQDRILEKVKKAGAHVEEVIPFETGHSPFATKSDELVKIVQGVCAKI